MRRLSRLGDCRSVFNHNVIPPSVLKHWPSSLSCSVHYAEGWTPARWQAWALLSVLYVSHYRADDYIMSSSVRSPTCLMGSAACWQAKPRRVLTLHCFCALSLMTVARMSESTQHPNTVLHYSDVLSCQHILHHSIITLSLPISPNQWI